MSILTAPDQAGAAPSRYIPTIERARAHEIPLPPGDPVEQDRWAALVVLITLLRRTSWKEEAFGAEASFAHIRRDVPPVPAGFERAGHVMVESIAPFGSCPMCRSSPGLGRCRICYGKGTFTLHDSERVVACSCKGKPVACPTCKGESTASRVVLRYFQDEPRHVRELTVPSHLPCHAPLFHLDSAMEQAIDIHVDPPEELRCHDLTGRAAGTAYRGGERIVRPTFHGHDFGDTIDHTLASLKALGAGAHVVRYDIRAYAWPILRLRYPNPKDPAAPRDIALFVDRAGHTHMVGE